MTTNEFDLKANDGLILKAKTWLPETPPKAVVCLVHGMGEHQNRYIHVAQAFTENDIALFTYDLRGHGISDGKRGHSPSFDQLLDDVERSLRNARSVYTDLPIILYGHSLGGNIVCNYILKRNTQELVGAVATSPWLRLAFDPPAWKVKLGNLMTNIFPSLTQPSKLDASLLSTDHEVAKIYTQDPLVHDKISAAMFNGVFNAGLWALDNASKLKIPLLIYHGDKDGITSAAATGEFAKSAGELAEVRTWEGMFHETHNEKDKEQVINYLVSWIKKKCNIS